jgi:hypothetical protein
MGKWFHEISDRIEVNSRRQNIMFFTYVRNKLVKMLIMEVYETINTSITNHYGYDITKGE